MEACVLCVSPCLPAGKPRATMEKTPKSYFPLLPTTCGLSPLPRPEGKQRVVKDMEQRELSQRLNFRANSASQSFRFLICKTGTAAGTSQSPLRER